MIRINIELIVAPIVKVVRWPSYVILADLMSDTIPLGYGSKWSYEHVYNAAEAPANGVKAVQSTK